ncbi:MAG TPA: hypothetical protein VJP86_13730 [Vicinamibacterales bacterium]|nr:hypothetical protein [Vicinamibacterales bacterium]
MPWSPNRAQWWIIWLVAVVCVLAWPPGNGGTSLGTKAMRWLADPSGTLPVMPEPLPLGLGDDGYAVAEHDAQMADYFAARDRSAFTRFRLRLRDAEDPVDPSTMRQLLIGFGVLSALGLWRLSGRSSTN